MKCKNCGAELMEGIMFCPECGEKNESDTENVTSAIYLTKEPEHEDSIQPVTEQSVESESAEQTVESESTEQSVESESTEQSVENESTIQTVESENTEQSIESESTEQTTESESIEPTVKSESTEQTTESESTEPASENTENIQDMKVVLEEEVFQQANKKFCPQCGTENTEEAVFCGKCGFSFTGGTVPPTQNDSKVKKGGRKGAAIGIVVAGIAAAAAIGGFLLFGNAGNGAGNASNLMYLKDNQINIMTGRKTITIDEDYYESKSDVGLKRNIQPIQYSADGKYLFYPVDCNYEGYDLYRRKANATKGEGVKVASGVSSYELLNSNKVIYLSDEGKLYISNMKDKDKVASDVRWFDLSDDNKYVFWFADDGDIYVQDIGLKKDKIKIDSDTTNVYYRSDDLKNILYVKDGDLYHAKNFEDKEKVASDISDVKVYRDKDNNDLKVYYTIIDEEGELTYNDIIDDDMASADAQMKEPDIKDYQTTTVVDSFWGPREKTETDDKYYEDIEKYYDKVRRDDIREYSDDTLNVRYMELYYYDVNKKSSEKVFSNSISDYLFSRGVYSITYYNLDDVSKIKMSELSQLDYSEIESKFVEMLADSIEVCALNGNKETALEVDITEYTGFGNSISYVPDNDMLYLMYFNKTSGSTLLSTNLSKDKGKVSEITDEAYSLELANENGVYYIVVEKEEDAGELYCNDKMISDDVALHSVCESDFASEVIYYYKDMRDSEGTLMMYKKGKETTVAEDVADYYEFDEGKIAVLMDYNFNKHRGDLKLYTGGKLKDIDTDVQSILRY